MPATLEEAFSKKVSVDSTYVPSPREKFLYPTNYTEILVNDLIYSNQYKIACAPIKDHPRKCDNTGMIVRSKRAPWGAFNCEEPIWNGNILVRFPSYKDTIMYSHNN